MQLSNKYNVSSLCSPALLLVSLAVPVQQCYPVFLSAGSRRMDVREAPCPVIVPLFMSISMNNAKDDPKFVERAVRQSNSNTGRPGMFS